MVVAQKRAGLQQAELELAEIGIAISITEVINRTIMNATKDFVLISTLIFHFHIFHFYFSFPIILLALLDAIISK